MRIGTIGYRTKTGLGYQVKSYVKHLPVTKVMVVNLNGYNGIPLTDWYPDAVTVNGYPREDHLSDFLKDIDVVLLAETPLNYNLYQIARDRGIKTAVVANWEFWDYYLNPQFPKPDLLIMPSVWRLEEAKQWANENGVRCVQIHHPVDREEFPFRERHTKSFIHIAGNPAVHDRNGTWTTLQAMPDVTVITQNDNLATHIKRKYRNARVLSSISEPQAMYEYSDILVFPRRYGGNCLPLNEALSSGMPAIMPDISPNNHLLPKEWLVPARQDGHFTPRTKVDLYSVDPNALREKIEWFKTCNIAEESRKADKIAETISWDTLRPKYMEALESIHHA